MEAGTTTPPDALQADYLQRVRNRMRVLYHERFATTGEERAFVTADDALRYYRETRSAELRKAGRRPSDDDLYPAFLEDVFAGPEWARVKRPGPAGIEGWRFVRSRS